MQSQKKVIGNQGIIPHALRIAKVAKPHNISETLLLPVAKDMCSVLMGEATAAKLDAIPMSDNTIQRHISDMAADVKQQILDAICESPLMLLTVHSNGVCTLLKNY